MIRTIAGLPWTAHSPSLLTHGHVTLAFDGRAWLVAVRGVYGTREFSSRDAAAELVATAFHNASACAQ